MKRSKKLFLILSVIFFIFLCLLGYDISRKTTFPGSKKLLRESLAPADSTNADTLSTITKTK